VTYTPSHRIHRLCGSLAGLPSGAVSFIDNLIDSGKCGTHDIGLEHVIATIDEGIRVEVLLERGAEKLFRCLASLRKLNEAHIKAVALHFILDCVDREVRAFGYWIGYGKENLLRVLDYCAKRIEDRVRGRDKPRGVIEGPSHSVIPLSPEGYYAALSKFIDDIVSYVHTFTSSYRDTLGKCLELLVEESKVKAQAVGPATVSTGLSELCRKLNIKCVYYVNGIQLPLVLAAGKVYSMLKRGETVRIVSGDGSVDIAVNSLEELLEKLLQLLSS